MKRRESGRPAAVRRDSRHARVLRAWWRCAAALLFALTGATTIAADPPQLSLLIGVSSRAMATLVVEPRLVWVDGIGGRRTACSLRTQFPALLAVRGELDTIAIAPGVSQEILAPRADGSVTPAVLPTARASVRLGIDIHNQALGRFVSMTGAIGLDAGVITGATRTGLSIAWEPTLAVRWRPGPGAPGAEPPDSDRTGTRPTARWIPTGASRLVYGLSVSQRMPSSASLEGTVAAVSAPGSMVHGFDGMMYGQWPFRIDAGVTLPPTERKWR